MEKERGVDRLSRYIIYGAVSAVVLTACWYFRSVIIYMILAAVMSLLGRPIMRMLRKIKIRKKQMPEALLAVITICIIHEGGISTGHDVYIRDIRSSIENSTESANPHATEDHTYCSKTQKQNAQKSDTRPFSSFRGGGRQLFSLFLGGIFSKIHLCTSFILLIIANFKIQ